MATLEIPGITSCEKGPADACRAVSMPWQPIANRKIILLATSTIHNDSLFVNGLYQNVFVLYKLFDSIGFAPILLVNDKPKEIEKVPSILRHTRMITVEEIARTPIPIHIYLEIGMSIDPMLRRVFKMGGARICKLYLGNILNIDIETPIFYHSMHFAHHVVGEIDEIWVSPHYKQHDEYAAVLNHVDLSEKSMRIAPYVWDSSILTLDGARNPKWRPIAPGEIETFVILEPNISFQKTALIPILIAERYYRAVKKPIRVIVGNGDRYTNSPFFMQSILPTLTMAADNCITFSGRHDIINIMRDYPYATAILHHYNNQYNYMTLEYMIANFPVVHNAPDWSDAAYYYKGNNLSEGTVALLRAQAQHATILERYKAGAEALKWRHSVYNPDVQKAWIAMLK